MKQHPLLAAVMGGVWLLSACSQDATVPGAGANDVSPAAESRDAGAPADAGDSGSTFDLARIPVSTVPLGEFPYITIPAAYSTDGRANDTKNFGRFPFWVDGKAHWVEGKFQLMNFDAAEEGQFSELEVQRNIDSLVTQMGGVKVSTARIPDAVIEEWGDPVMLGFIDGIGDIYNNPATTYVVRRNDGNIWIHLSTTNAEGSMVIAQEKAFAPTAAMVPASDLKQQLDADGKVVVPLNFATDRTEILADSQPQLEQVLQLLQADESLRLAIHGHTDNVGSAAHNRQLSQGRAEAVMNTLVGRGIEPARLLAEGHGDSVPVDDNANEAGRARNRRVELVKR